MTEKELEGQERVRGRRGEKELLGGDRKCYRVSRAIGSTLAFALRKKESRQGRGLPLGIRGTVSAAGMERHVPAVVQVREGVWLRV